MYITSLYVMGLVCNSDTQYYLSSSPQLLEGMVMPNSRATGSTEMTNLLKFSVHDETT